MSLRADLLFQTRPPQGRHHFKDRAAGAFSLDLQTVMNTIRIFVGLLEEEGLESFEDRFLNAESLWTLPAHKLRFSLRMERDVRGLD